MSMRMLPDRPPTPREGAAARWVLTTGIEKACAHLSRRPGDNPRAIV